MGGPLGSDWPCAKGPVPYGLDTISKGVGARARLEQLRNAIMALPGGKYQGLESVFETHVLRPIYPDPKDAAAVAVHLKTYWFDETSKDAYFPNVPVAQIYAEGVLKASELSLNGKPDPVPIDAWWVVDQPEVKLLELALVGGNGVTRSQSVVLLVLTPRPPADKARMVILNKEAVAWVTEHQTGRVVTRKVGPKS